jgi:hypothetical protein
MFKNGIVLIVTLGLFIAGCASAPKSMEVSDSTVPPAVALGEQPEQTASVDLVGIQRDLGLDRDFKSLGYQEKVFNTCEVGYGYSATKDCRKEYFVVVHFQLLCRNSVGTVSRALSSTDMRPISIRPISWNLKGPTGVIRTDSSGFGQIRTVASESQKNQRLKLTLGSDFLYMRAGEITKVVTPQPWCAP